MIIDFYEDGKFRIFTDYESDRAYVQANDGDLLMICDLKRDRIKTKKDKKWRTVPEHFDMIKEAEGLIK